MMQTGSEALLNRLENALQEIESLFSLKRQEVEALKEKIQDIHKEKDALNQKVNYTDQKLEEIQAKLELIIEGQK